ncbi:sensor histidine kinase [Derxia gummosa]|uniref:histidine kinase n=1 Tax=Derxia gummosa DSM 723 TaxID=1121388 RepID=A0A8B6X5H6_9BURK|nr:response regulator [Derxia gummosa]
MTESAASPLARLLIVDDEVAQMRALCDTLQDEGYATTGCTDAASALDLLRAKPFDLLLSDLMMPGMDGIALLRAALAIDPMLIVIIMTGEGSISSAVEAMRAGAQDYILKPFRLSAALPVISRGLSMRQLRIDNAALERRVREHSAELEAANRELDAFTRSASHDLRTPVAAVMGLSELLLLKAGPTLPADQRDWLASIHKSARHMNRLIDDLMRLSRFGGQALVPEPVDMTALAREVADERLAQEAGRDIRLAIEPLAPARADRALVRQVFVNLLSNAIKYSRDRDPACITVGCDTAGAVPAWFVKDNGVGFDMGDAARLFDAFERLHGADRFEGSGVGLTIVQRIVVRHGGRVWAEASPGQGACFHFTLASDAG